MHLPEHGDRFDRMAAPGKAPRAAQARLRSECDAVPVGDQTRATAPAIASASDGSTSVAASPAISGRLVVLLQTTGHPLAMASSTGMPKPSNNDGKTRHAAPR